MYLVLHVDKICSTNSLYRISGRRLVKKQEVRDFEKEIIENCYQYEGHIDERCNLFKGKELTIKYQVFLNKRYSVRDIDNMVKALQDSLFKVFNLDDSIIKEMSIIKRNNPVKGAEKETIIVEVLPYIEKDKNFL